MNIKMNIEKRHVGFAIRLLIMAIFVGALFNLISDLVQGDNKEMPGLSVEVEGPPTEFSAMVEQGEYNLGTGEFWLVLTDGQRIQILNPGIFINIGKTIERRTDAKLAKSEAEETADLLRQAVRGIAKLPTEQMYAESRLRAAEIMVELERAQAEEKRKKLEAEEAVKEKLQQAETEYNRIKSEVAWIEREQKAWQKIAVLEADLGYYKKMYVEYKDLYKALFGKCFAAIPKTVPRDDFLAPGTYEFK
jgi:hypothetical protein